MTARTLGVALLGHGTVGGEVARLLREQADDLAARAGARLELRGVARRSDPDVDPLDLVARDDVDIVVELIGGIEPARTLILAALEAGKSVVTANKALLAHAGPELFEAAEKSGADLYYEAAVAGAIPILRPLRESLAGDRVLSVMGIVNGTTNFILDRMDTFGTGYADALAEAQALGYAEADPSADVDGHDAAAKASILASLAFHTRVSISDVAVEGIGGVTAETVASARSLGQVIKLLAVAERIGRRISVRVHPVMIPRVHPLASVHDAFNAVFVTTEAAGELMFYGRGAGGAPTASAVLGDVVTVARNAVGGHRGVGESAYADVEFVEAAEVRTRCHISLDVADETGVLASIAEAFARNGVSIQAVHQTGHGPEASLAVVTHIAAWGRLSDTIAQLRELDAVREVASCVRVLGDE